MKRAHIKAEVKLAALVLQIDKLETALKSYTDRYRPVAVGQGRFPYEESKSLTAKQILSTGDFHHWPVQHADGGPDEPWNLEWAWKAEHWSKTIWLAKDRAKAKRITRKFTITHDNPDVKPVRAIIQKKKWPSRPFPKARPIRKMKHGKRTPRRGHRT